MVALNTVLSSIAVIALIGANAFFVADEFALVAVDRAQVGLQAAKGEKVWLTVHRLRTELSFHLSAAQLGITVSTLIFGFLSADFGRAILSPITDPIFGQETSAWLTVPIAFMLANALQVVMGEVVPKTVAIAQPMRILRLIANGIAVWGFLVRPVVNAVNQLADRIVRLMGFEPTEELAGLGSVNQLESVIKTSGEQGTLDPEDVARLTRTIRFADKTAADILVPRVDLATLERESSLAELCELSRDTGHSRFPVTGRDSDDVLGLVHAKVALGIHPDERSKISVNDHLTQALAVPETRALDSLLAEMYSEGQQFAFVLDEHGGLAGIVTSEDIVEEILGEIDDEHDLVSTSGVQRLSSGELVLSGSVSLDEFEESTGLGLPEGDYETLAGLAIDRLQRIPKIGDQFDCNQITFEILEMDRWRIARIRVGPGPTSDDPNPQAEVET